MSKSTRDAIKFLINASYNGAESKFKNQITTLKNENQLLKDKVADLEAKLAEKEDRINWLVEAEFNRKWAKKYVEMRRKEDPMLCLPDSDEVYERYFELKQQLEEKDEEIEEWNTLDDLCELLNQQAQLIAELEEQLKNAIVPKFKLDQNVYRVYQDNIESGMICAYIVDDCGITYHLTFNKSKYCETYCYVNEKDLFATKEEAQAKLQELNAKNV